MALLATQYQRLIASHLDAARYPQFFAYLLKFGRVIRQPSLRPHVVQGQHLDHLGLLLSGKAEAYSLDVEGQQILVAEAPPGTWYGMMEFLDGQPSAMTGHPLGEALLLQIPHRQLRAKEAPKAEIFELVAHALASNLRLAHRVFAEHKIPDIEARLLTRLRSLADGEGRITITQDKLAGYLDISRFQVLRLLEKLEQRGVLKRHYGRIELLGEK
ncbi:Crp/Fnr family transcriptional regulator [Ferrimonas balearica]|uniref:Crp/Fnr family transcriptional regulator n=1 Tax=Ferrimonas balearica TaxID=44012 RepID=UPI001C9A211E|nr:Crp/Fnr family transcriptional regulator [Ferrimonas balearica]MBY5991779.1 Crp/Fnr family transcriptional regulator [Ferrimonas balearica]